MDLLLDESIPITKGGNRIGFGSINEGEEFQELDLKNRRVS